MRYQQLLVPLAVAAMSLVTVTGMAFSDAVPQAVYAESMGFDALVHAVAPSADVQQVAAK
ncbi:MAG: hypothetical protein V4463_19255 [Pseudomonadota bacterium]